MLSLSKYEIGGTCTALRPSGAKPEQVVVALPSSPFDELRMRECGAPLRGVRVRQLAIGRGPFIVVFGPMLDNRFV